MIFNSYVSLPEGNLQKFCWSMKKTWHLPFFGLPFWTISVGTKKGTTSNPIPYVRRKQGPTTYNAWFEGYVISDISSKCVYIYICKGGVLCHWGTPSSHPCDFVIFGFSIFSPIQLLGFPHNLGNPHIYSIYPLVNQHNYGKSPCLKCKSTN